MTQFAALAPASARARAPRRSLTATVDLRVRQAEAAAQRDLALASTVPATAAAQPVYGVGFYVMWWLIQGIALGTAGGLAICSVVIALVLGLRALLG